MATLPDLFYVALFAVVFPLWDYCVFWPAFRRKPQSDVARDRTRLWARNIGNLWALVAVGAALWVANGRSWTSFGLSAPDGWRLWTSIALVLLLTAYYAFAAATVDRSSDARASLLQQAGPTIALMPHTRTELYWFGGVSLTAGFCEEFLFRGYFIWVVAEWLGWWGAAALSVAVFAGLHAYQGWNAALRTAIFGAFYTLVLAIFNSLWPAIALHVLVDSSAGLLVWLAIRKRDSS